MGCSVDNSILTIPTRYLQGRQFRQNINSPVDNNYDLKKFVFSKIKNNKQNI